MSARNRVTGGQTSGTTFPQGRLAERAFRHRLRPARAKPAARRRIDRRRDVALLDDPLARIVIVEDHALLRGAADLHRPQRTARRGRPVGDAAADSLERGDAQRAVASVFLSRHTGARGALA